MMNTIKLYVLSLLALFLFMHSLNIVEAFVGTGVPRISSRLSIGPFQKTTNRQEYNQVIENLMLGKGLTREEAEKEYNAFLDNPNNYALEKGEAYYKSLGYKNLMEGVIGEAEKEGRGDEVKARIEKFRKESQLKGLVTIGFFIAIGFYLKITHPYIPPNQL